MLNYHNYSGKCRVKKPEPPCVGRKPVCSKKGSQERRRRNLRKKYRPFKGDLDP